MKHHLFQTADTPTRHLILLFAGWGMDHKLFRDLSVPGYDLCVVWDYRNMSEAFTELIADYDEIAVVAWSFGVPAAAKFISSHPELPITSTIAINGTQHPVDDTLGIPETIFQGTLDSLTERSLGKFHLRMAGSSAAYKAFSANLPDRDIDGLKEELRAVKRNDTPVIKWDKAIIADNDRIIPTANQLNAWKEEAFKARQYTGSHLPDFAALLPELLTDKTLVERRFHRATTTYDTNAVIQKQIADHLISQWDVDKNDCIDILEIGCGTGYMTRLICDKTNFSSLTLWDLTFSEKFIEEFSAKGAVISACDAETAIRLLPDESLDAIVSASTVQWFNSLPAFLRRAAKKLRQGGKIVISTFGPDTMCEINTPLGKSSSYPDVNGLLDILPDTLAIEYIAEERLTLTFPSPIDVLRHVRLTGVNALSTSSSPATTRSLLRNYPLLPSLEAPLTYQPIYLILTKHNHQS